MKETGKTLFHYLILIRYKALADLYMEIGKSRFGLIWFVIEPIIYMGIFYVVFGVMFPQQEENFPSFLMCGLIPWRWFSEGVIRGVSSISGNANLMSQVYIHKLFFPLVTVAVSTLKHLVMLVLLLVFVVVAGNPPTSAWLALPMLFFVQLLFVAGCSCVVASLEPFYPDLRLMTDNIITGLFFLSGVFFDPVGLSPNMARIFDTNPVTVMIRCYRSVLMDGTWPAGGSIAYLLFLSFALLAFAWAVVHRFDRTYPKVVIQ